VKRFILWALFVAFLGLVAAEGGRWLWVKVNPDSGRLELSNGQPLPASLKGQVVPGQFLEGGRWPTRTWRPPMDIEKTFKPESASRVVFSHERHFAALGAKGAACESCHQQLSDVTTWPSLAPSPSLEPHGPKSIGRFCASCHDGQKQIQDVAAKIPGAKPPVNATLFSAFGKKGDESCSRCHVPKDHGQDFTPWHGDIAEGGAASCADCHRGATAISAKELNQVQDFFHAQLSLWKNPENDQAFNQTLPNNFCAYCHGIDQKAWRGD